MPWHGTKHGAKGPSLWQRESKEANTYILLPLSFPFLVLRACSPGDGSLHIEETLPKNTSQTHHSAAFPVSSGSQISQTDNEVVLQELVHPSLSRGGQGRALSWCGVPQTTLTFEFSHSS